MNKVQNDYMNKDFSLDKKYSLTRGDFEYFPCPMVAITWTDEEIAEIDKFWEDIV